MRESVSAGRVQFVPGLSSGLCQCSKLHFFQNLARVIWYHVTGCECCRWGVELGMQKSVLLTDPIAFHGKDLFQKCCQAGYRPWVRVGNTKRFEPNTLKGKHCKRFSAQTWGYERGHKCYLYTTIVTGNKTNNNTKKKIS